MKNNLPPLHYAIIKCFSDGDTLCAEDVMSVLGQDYSSYKLFNGKDIEEALATAKENGLLEEAKADIDGKGRLRIFYQMTDFGKKTIQRYLA